MQPVPRQHLHNPHPSQNTRRQRIQRSQRDNRTRVITIELIEYADPNGHTNGRDEREDSAHDAFLQGRGGGFGQLGDAGTESDAFEHLVEEYDDEEGYEEAVARYDEGYADDLRTGRLVEWVLGSVCEG